MPYWILRCNFLPLVCFFMEAFSYWMNIYNISWLLLFSLEKQFNTILSTSNEITWNRTEKAKYSKHLLNVLVTVDTNRFVNIWSAENCKVKRLCPIHFRSLLTKKVSWNIQYKVRHGRFNIHPLLAQIVSRTRELN